MTLSLAHREQFPLMPKRQRREILVVDDELADLELMCQALRLEGHSVLPASGYLAGVQTLSLHKGEIDLLVTDVSLPGKNGCELAKNLLARRPNLRVLFVSGPSGAEICQFYGMLGPGMHFLEKPIKVDEFVRLVRLILEPAMPVGTAGAAGD